MSTAWLSVERPEAGAPSRLVAAHSGADASPPLPRERNDDAPGASVHRLRTYIVEDSAVIRENLIATLEELVPTQVVGTADNEATAVQWLQQPENACDLVIVDIFLKSGSGLGVLSAIASLHEHTRLVVLSNYATPDMRRKCAELGAHKVFDKSNEIDALINYCQRLAAGEATGFGPL